MFDTIVIQLRFFVILHPLGLSLGCLAAPALYYRIASLGPLCPPWGRGGLPGPSGFEAVVFSTGDSLVAMWCLTLELERSNKHLHIPRGVSCTGIYEDGSDASTDSTGCWNVKSISFAFPAPKCGIISVSQRIWWLGPHPLNIHHWQMWAIP